MSIDLLDTIRRLVYKGRSNVRDDGIYTVSFFDGVYGETMMAMEEGERAMYDNLKREDKINVAILITFVLITIGLIFW